MDAIAAKAASLYAQAARSAATGGMPGPDKAGASFADMLGQVTRDNVATLRTGEGTSVTGVAGKTDMVDVVTAVNAAEITLQTVVAVRDRVVQAYQDIMRMPI